jgi:hypothetical protein
MFSVGISPEILSRVVNERHQGLISDGLDRIVAVHWVDPASAILVDCTVTRRENDVEQKLTTIHEVAPQLALRISSVLPAGSVHPGSAISELLPIVAESFGAKVTGDANEDAAWVYEGPWDGRSIHVLGYTGQSTIFVTGSLYPDLKRCELVWSLDREKYLKWFAGHLANSVRYSIPIQSSRDWIGAQKTVLEGLFPDRWFTDAQGNRLKHPAYVRWRACVDLLAKNGQVQLPADLEMVKTILSAWLDNFSLIKITGGSVDALKLGDLANYGDEVVQKRLRAVIQEPNQFFDALVVVSCAGWHLTRGHRVTATEKDGMPDLALEISEWQLPIQAEGKRIRQGTSYSPVKGAIEKANMQVKNAKQRCYGLVYLDVSDRVDVASLGDDELSNEIVAIQNEVRHWLNRFYTSVSGVILLWKYPTILPMRDGGVLCLVRCKSLLIRHRQPKESLPENPEPVLLGYTAMLQIVRPAES